MVKRARALAKLLQKIFLCKAAHYRGKIELFYDCKELVYKYTKLRKPGFEPMTKWLRDEHSLSHYASAGTPKGVKRKKFTRSARFKLRIKILDLKKYFLI